MDLNAYKEKYELIRNYHNDRLYKKALALVEEMLEEYEFSAELYILRSVFLQLAETEENVLTKVESDLTIATSLSPAFSKAWLEYAFFEYAVKDNPQQAYNLFVKAEEIAEANWKDSLIGQIKCMIEIGETEKALEIIEEGKRIFKGDSEFDLLRDEIGQ